METSEDKMPKEIYYAIDWKRCVVGGSYALKQFMGKKNNMGTK
jgi:hypothetical protein